MRAKSSSGRARIMVLYTAIALTTGGCGLLAPDEDRTKDGATVENYFPLHVGDTWWYEYCIMGSPPSTRSITVTDSALFDGRTYYAYSIDSLAPQYFRVDHTGNVYRYYESLAEEALHLDFHAAEGDTYSISNTIVKVEQRNLTVETSAGSFSDCIEFRFNAPDIIGEEINQVFAHGVGMVQSHSGGTFWFTMKLSAATINGVEYPQ